MTPKTGYVFGTVTDGQGRRAAGVTVDVNGVTGRDRRAGPLHRGGLRIRGLHTTRSDQRLEEAQRRAGLRSRKGCLGGKESHIAFAANTPKREDIVVAQATDIATVNGFVTHSGTGTGVGGVEIWVDYGAGPAGAPAQRDAPCGAGSRQGAGQDQGGHGSS